MKGETKLEPLFDAETACEVCGRFGAYLFEGKDALRRML
jgi:hypothetical protein